MSSRFSSTAFLIDATSCDWLREGAAAGAGAAAAPGGGQYGFGGGNGGAAVRRPRWQFLVRVAAGCGRRRGGCRGAGGQHFLVAGDGDRELLDQHAELVDFADHGPGCGPRRRNSPTPSCPRWRRAGVRIRRPGGPGRRCRAKGPRSGRRHRCGRAAASRRRCRGSGRSARSAPRSRIPMPLMPAIEYSTRPSEAATSTMQMAMKIVDIRIMLRATPSRPNAPTRENAESSGMVCHALPKRAQA